MRDLWSMRGETVGSRPGFTCVLGNASRGNEETRKKQSDNRDGERVGFQGKCKAVQSSAKQRSANKRKKNRNGNRNRPIR